MILILWIIVTLIELAFTAPVTLAWDAGSGAEFYELQYGQDPSNLSSRARVTSLNTQITVDLVPGLYNFEVVGIYPDGTASEPSNRVEHEVKSTNAVPTLHKQELRIVKILSSDSLDGTWVLDGYYVVRPKEDGAYPQKQFFKMEAVITHPTK